jgi:hypothetical protein
MRIGNKVDRWFLAGDLRGAGYDAKTLASVPGWARREIGGMEYLDGQAIAVWERHRSGRAGAEELALEERRCRADAPGRPDHSLLGMRHAVTSAPAVPAHFSTSALDGFLASHPALQGVSREAAGHVRADFRRQFAALYREERDALLADRTALARYFAEFLEAREARTLTAARLDEAAQLQRAYSGAFTPRYR